ncbi:MAG: glycoside hydrolase family protein [Gammaproteobacteria bacterium]
MRSKVLSIWVAGFLLAQALAGCASQRTQEFLSIDKMTPGIFTEVEERAVLPAGVEVRKVFNKGIQLTKESEGFVDRLYNDAARFCTIAYGHLVKKAPCNGTEPEHFQDGITEPEGVMLLRDDMEIAERSVMTLVDVALTDGQFAALSDFVFNVGSGNFRQSTLLKMVNKGRHDQVPFQLRRWVKAGGRELPGLITRREREIVLYFEDVGIPRAVPAVDQDLSPIDILKGEGKQ